MNKEEIIEMLNNVSDNPTNGEMIEALYPTAKIHIPTVNISSAYLNVYVNYGNGQTNYYKLDWWNARWKGVKQ